jgi:hypothetical protein
MTTNPFYEIRKALWRKIDDSGAGGGAELLHSWAATHNPAQGLTTFRLDDAEDGGFPTEIRSGESPSLYIGSRPSQKYSFAPGRYFELPEQFEVVGLVLGALLWDYPRLLGDDNLPLPGIKSFTIVGVTREIPATDELFFKFTILVEVKFCVDLRTWSIQ